MDLVMRNGVLGTALCLIGLQSAVECQLNWKNSKVSSEVVYWYTLVPGSW